MQPTQFLRRHTLFVVLITVSWFVAQLTFAAEPIAYKVSQLGIGLTRFTTLNPEFKCAPIDVAMSTSCISKSSTYAGFKAEEVKAFFLEGGLSYVEVSLFQRPDSLTAIFAFGTIQGALIGKYGEPVKINDKLGGLARKISIWKAEGSTIQLSHSENGVTHLVDVMIFRDDYWERSSNQRRSKAKADV